MKVNKEIKLNNGKIEIVTKQEYQFSDLEKEILNKLALNGYYETEKPYFSSERERNAVNNLVKLGLVTLNVTNNHYTIEVVKSEEVGSFFLQILKEGI